MFRERRWFVLVDVVVLNLFFFFPHFAAVTIANDRPDWRNEASEEQRERHNTKN